MMTLLQNYIISGTSYVRGASSYDLNGLLIPSKHGTVLYSLQGLF